VRTQAPKDASDLPHPEASTPAGRRDDGTTAPRQRGRYVPAAVRRAVWARDGERCTFVDDQGRRCQARAFLELDHVHERALGGTGESENLRVLCRAHNQLLAELRFGRAHIEQRIHLRQRKSAAEISENGAG